MSGRWLASSSRFQPAPTPSCPRPPASPSGVARAKRSCSSGNATPVPISSRSVAQAAAVRLTKGSIIRRYCAGSSPPAGYAVARDAGMCGCSPTQNDSKPRSSSHAARTSGAASSGVFIDANPSSTVASVPDSPTGSPRRVDEDFSGGPSVRDPAQGGGGVAQRVHGVDVGGDATGREQVEQLGAVAFGQVGRVEAERPDLEALDDRSLEEDQVERDPRDLAAGEADRDEAPAPAERAQRALR